jgi:hypothetical protein
MTAKFLFSGINIKNIAGLFSTINPSFQLSRVMVEKDEVVIYNSEIIKGTRNPGWAEFEMNLQKMCNNVFYRPIRLQVFHNKGTQKKYISECEFTIQQIMGNNKREFTLSKPNKKSSKSDGTIRLEDFMVKTKPNFLEYLRGGTQINVMLGIDFTGSNGDPSLPNSLHSQKDDDLNDYQKAISSVCEILLCYDYDKKIAMYGYGAKPAGAS